MQQVIKKILKWWKRKHCSSKGFFKRNRKLYQPLCKLFKHRGVWQDFYWKGWGKALGFFSVTMKAFPEFVKTFNKCRTLTFLDMEYQFLTDSILIKFGSPFVSSYVQEGMIIPRYTLEMDEEGNPTRLK